MLNQSTTLTYLAKNKSSHTHTHTHGCHALTWRYLGFLVLFTFNNYE